MHARDEVWIKTWLPCISPIFVKVISQLDSSKSNLKSSERFGLPLFVIQATGNFVVHGYVEYVVLNLVHLVLTHIESPLSKMPS